LKESEPATKDEQSKKRLKEPNFDQPDNNRFVVVPDFWIA